MLLLKPDRRIITPGWDDLPIDRPRIRVEDSFWRWLLSGRAKFNRKPGCCCSSGPSCQGCTENSSPCTISWTAPGTTSCCISCTSQGGTATFTPWQATPCQNVVNPCPACGGGWGVSLICVSNQIALSIQAACPGGGGFSCNNLFPSSVQCSPLLLTFTPTTAGGCSLCFSSITVTQ